MGSTPERSRAMEVNTYKVMEEAVEDGVRHGWHRAHKHLDHESAPVEGVAIEVITDAVMLHIAEYFTLDSFGPAKVKDQILEIVERSLRAKQEALAPENRSESGYPYCAGYMESALVQIASIIRGNSGSLDENQM